MIFAALILFLVFFDMNIMSICKPLLLHNLESKYIS